MENRIIAVDDDRDFLEILGMHLVDFGYRDFRVEEDPLKAAALFHKGEAFDLALIDMHMPELDGMALLDLIKTISPTTECIMITAVNDARVRWSAFAKGPMTTWSNPSPAKSCASPSIAPWSANASWTSSSSAKKAACRN
jgi:two-component system response regulator AtoC